jgi:diguanylate cyclase (GGDEF)-like protein
MNLDVNTLLTLMLVNVFAMAIAIPLVMGWRVSPAARCVLGSALAQASAWGSFLLARPVHDRLFSTIWIGMLGASFVLMWHALRGWLGPRPGRPLLWAIAVLTPLGYGLGFDHYAFRVGWSNFGLAFLLSLVCFACAWPAPHADRRWRGLIIICLGSLALVTLGRGVLGAFFTDLYPTLRTPHPINVFGALLNHIVLTLTTIALLVGWHEEAERDLRAQAETDGLTGILNRRAWCERAQAAIVRARRSGEALAVLMLDIDHFKRVNDVEGHAAGDRALQRMAAALRKRVRSGDLVCRYGGEEFCVLLLQADAKTALEVDAGVRRELADSASAGSGLMLTFSSGLATLSDDTGLDSLLRRADHALYEAKAAGRNRLVVADRHLLKVATTQRSSADGSKIGASSVSR